MIASRRNCASATGLTTRSSEPDPSARRSVSSASSGTTSARSVQCWLTSGCRTGPGHSCWGGSASSTRPPVACCSSPGPISRARTRSCGRPSWVTSTPTSSSPGRHRTSTSTGWSPSSLTSGAGRTSPGWRWFASSARSGPRGRMSSANCSGATASRSVSTRQAARMGSACSKRPGQPGKPCRPCCCSMAGSWQIPSNAEVGEALGVPTKPAGSCYDVTVIGAGPPASRRPSTVRRRACPRSSWSRRRSAARPAPAR